MTFLEIWDFARDSILAVVVAGALCAYLGVYVLLRRVVFVSAAVTQASGVGIALAFWIASFVVAESGHMPAWLSPQVWSLLGGLVCALVFSRSFASGRLASESVVGLAWVIAGAALLLILSSKRIVQEAREVDDLLYGSAILVTPSQLRTLAIGAGALLAIHIAFFKELVFVSYDAEMAQTLGYRTHLWNAFLFATLGIGISLAVRTLGALPAFGFLVIPGAAAQLLVKRVVWTFPLAVFIAITASVAGYAVSFAKDLPAGPVLVGCAALFLVPGLLLRLFRR